MSAERTKISEQEVVLATQIRFYAYNWSFNNRCKCKENIIYRRISVGLISETHYPQVMLLYFTHAVTPETSFSVTPRPKETLSPQSDHLTSLLNGDISFSNHNIYIFICRRMTVIPDLFHSEINKKSYIISIKKKQPNKPIETNKKKRSV